MAITLFIIAAGKGSRMKINLPKALVPITDEPCLTTTLQQIGSKFEKVVIVTNIDIQKTWASYFKETGTKYPGLLDNVSNMPISSGLGDGHAVLKALQQLPGPNHADDEIVVAWGDIFFANPGIIDELLSASSIYHSGFIPAIKEDNPYVTLLVDDFMRCRSADFSKYGENHEHGFHDQSVFKFKQTVIKSALTSLHNSLWKNGRYMTQGGELSLLHAFHYLYNSGTPLKVYQTDYPTMSFNTPEEVAHIQQELKTSWLNRS